MPELPPPLPVAIEVPPPQVSPSREYRYTLEPLNEQKNSFLALNFVLALVGYGIYYNLTDTFSRGFSFEELLKQISIFIFMSLNAWFVAWTALGTAHIALRILTSAFVITVFLLYLGIGGSQNLTTAIIITALYVGMLRLFRWRIMKAQRLFVSALASTDQADIQNEKNVAARDFVLIPKNSSTDQIEAFANWHLYRHSKNSRLLDAFRPDQFHLQHLFQITCFVGLSFLVIRLIIAYSDWRYISPQDPASFIFMIAGVVAPILTLLLTFAMWSALGRKRIFAKYAALLLSVFACAFIYHVLDTPQTANANLKIDFEMALLNTRDIGMGFFVASVPMLIARWLGYRLIRLPLNADGENFRNSH